MSMTPNPAGALSEAPDFALIADILRDHLNMFALARSEGHHFSGTYTDEAILAQAAACEAADNASEAVTSRAGDGPVAHEAKAASIETACREVFVPCDCGCGRSCCAMCGSDCGFVQYSAHPQAAAQGVTDEMVELAREAYIDHATTIATQFNPIQYADKDCMRAAITAAWNRRALAERVPEGFVVVPEAKMRNMVASWREAACIRRANGMGAQDYGTAARQFGYADALTSLADALHLILDTATPQVPK